MKAKKIFKRMVKIHDENKSITYVSNFENVREVAKILISLPNTIIEDVHLESPEWDGYEGAFLLTFDEDNTIWIQKAYFDDGRIARGTGIYIIDNDSIGTHKPEEFLIESDIEDNEIIVIGGEFGD